MDPNTAFSISRIVLIVASAITLCGGIGIWYFGGIVSKNQERNIQQSKEDASVANQKAAEANERTKVVELNVVEARKETSKAKLETEKVKLKVEKANKEAEKAKLEREKLQQQTIKLKRENESLKVESDRIKTFRISVQLVIRDDGSFNQSAIHDHPNPKGRLSLTEKFGGKSYEFLGSSTYRVMLHTDGRIVIETYLTPLNSGELYTSSIKSLESVQDLFLDLGILIEGDRIVPIEPITIHVNYNINEVNVTHQTYLETGINTMKHNKPLKINVENEFKNIYDKYKEVTNNK